MQEFLFFANKTQRRKWASESQTPLQMPTMQVIKANYGLDNISMRKRQWK